MKRMLALVLCFASLVWALDATARFPRGTPATSSNPNLRQENFYGLTGSAWQNPSGWYVPGTGSPAISTADFYHTDGAMWMRAVNLLDAACGATGASIAASKGQYVWFLSADHSDGVPWSGDAQDVVIGFSSDPGVPPTKVSVAYPRWRLTPLAQSATITAKIDNGAGGAGTSPTLSRTDMLTGEINPGNLFPSLVSGSDQGMYSYSGGFGMNGNQAQSSVRAQMVFDKDLSGAQVTSWDALVR